MISYQNLDTNDQLDEGLSQKISSYSHKTQPFKFLQHLNNKNSKKNISSSNSKEGVINEFLQLQEYKSMNTKQIQLISMKTQNPYQYRQESQVFQFQNSLSEKQHNRKKFIVQKRKSKHQPLDGEGFTKLEDGKVVFGQWKNGIFIKNARIIYPSGNFYIGQVKGYIRHGRGLLIYINGERYVGNFINGKYDGYGTKYNAQFEKICEGVWRQGILVKGFN